MLGLILSLNIQRKISAFNRGKHTPSANIIFAPMQILKIKQPNPTLVETEMRVNLMDNKKVRSCPLLFLNSS